MSYHLFTPSFGDSKDEIEASRDLLFNPVELFHSLVSYLEDVVGIRGYET